MVARETKEHWEDIHLTQNGISIVEQCPIKKVYIES